MDSDEELLRLSESIDKFNKDKEAKRLKEYREKYPERFKKAMKKWDAKNRVEYQREWRKKKSKQ